MRMPAAVLKGFRLGGNRKLTDISSIQVHDDLVFQIFYFFKVLQLYTFPRIYTLRHICMAMEELTKFIFN